MVKYSTISIPKELHEEIKKTFIDNPRYGYSSVAEFSMEAIKIRLDEIKRTIDDEKKDKSKIIKKAVLNIRKSLE